jgi:hypothetical protein
MRKADTTGATGLAVVVAEALNVAPGAVIL